MDSLSSFSTGHFTLQTICFEQQCHQHLTTPRPATFFQSPVFTNTWGSVKRQYSVKHSFRCVLCVYYAFCWNCIITHYFLLLTVNHFIFVSPTPTQILLLLANFNSSILSIMHCYINLSDDIVSNLVDF